MPMHTQKIHILNDWKKVLATGTKICCYCYETKPVCKFSKATGKKDGYASRCKDCVKKIANLPENYVKSRKSSKSYQSLPKTLQERKEREITPQYKKTNRLYRESIHGRFITSRIEAKARNLYWEFTELEYSNLLDQKCTYCDKSLTENHQIGVGLDRMDNDKGYLKNNVVPCCGLCNRTRANWFTFDEFLQFKPILTKIRKEREKKNNGK